jgi:hypothetical protein
MTLSRIARFEVQRPLGSGSFATVWLARDEDLDAWVAIKLLAENWSFDEDARDGSWRMLGRSGAWTATASSG